MTSRVTTVQDSNGEVWTGREVDTSDPVADIGAAVLTFGMTAIADAIDGDSGNRTVEVNGECHYGKRV